MQWTHVYIPVCVSICICTSGGLRKKPDILFYHLQPSFLEKLPLIESGGRLVTCQFQRSPCLYNLQRRNYICAGFICGFWLLTASSPSPAKKSLLLCFYLNIVCPGYFSPSYWWMLLLKLASFFAMFCSSISGLLCLPYPVLLLSIIFASLTFCFPVLQAARPQLSSSFGHQQGRGAGKGSGLTLV